MEIVVRPARAADGPAMGWVHVRAWRDAYRAEMPADYLRSLDQVAVGERWRARLAAPAPGDPAVFVGLANWSLVAMASAGRHRDPDEPEVGEVWMINVEPDHQHLGIGRALLATAIDSLGNPTDGSPAPEQAVLWVVTSNTGARKFYENLGWWADGQQRSIEIGGTEVLEVRYRTRIAG